MGEGDWYRDWRRIGPGVASVVVLLLVVLLLPSRVRVDGNTTPSALGGIRDPQVSATPGQGQTGTVATAGPGGVAGPTAGVASRPDGGGGGQLTVTGVTDDAVKVGFFYLPEGQSCGQSVEAAVVALGFADTPRRSTSVLVEYFNEHGNTELFGLPEGSGYHGRRVELIEYNDGGFFCPENSKAAALQSTDDGIFAAIGGSNSDVQDPIWASNGIVKLEYEFFSDAHYDAYPGLIYSAVPGASVSRRLGSQYIAKYLWNRPATYSPDPTLTPPAEPVRKFGWISADLPDYHLVHERMEEDLTRLTGQPFEFEHEIFFQADLSTAGQQAAAGAQAFKSAGVTTVVWFGYALAPVYGTPAMTSAAYFPEHLVVGHAGLDQDRFAQGYDQDQWANAFGFSLNPPEAHKDEWRSTLDFRKVDDGDVPDDADFWWKELYHFFRGLAAAGPDLTVASWAEGIQSSCQPCPKFQSPGSEPTVNYRSGDYTTSDDAMMIFWNPSKRSRYQSDDDSPAGGYDYFHDPGFTDKVADGPEIPWSKIVATRHDGF